jgi:hypothetical protein
VEAQLELIWVGQRARAMQMAANIIRAPILP